MKPFGKSHLTRIPRSRMARWTARLLLLAAMIMAGSALAHTDPDGSGSPTATPKPKHRATPKPGASVTPSATPSKFQVPIPTGHDAEHMAIPYLDNRGRLQMFVVIKKAVRTDDGHLAMENASIQTYDDKGDPDANIYLARSVLDLDTRIVTSEVPVFVRRSDFVIVGQKMVFNTQTHVGHMSGHVRMAIFNHQEVAGGTPTPTPSPSPTSSPSPATPAALNSPAPSPTASS
jgi:hypothetical protein